MMRLNSRDMKTIRYILTCASALLMLLACVKETSQEAWTAIESLLKVRLSVPEIEVKSDSTTEIYAYLFSEIEEGMMNPISETRVNKDDGITYYNIPAGATELVFTSLCGESDEKVDISIDEDGNILYSIDTVATGGKCLFDKDILAGYIDGIVPGNKDPYDVQVKRLSSKLTTNFMVKNTSGTLMNINYLINSVNVEYSGFSDSATLLDDETVAVSGNHNEQIALKANSASSENKLYSHSANFIPSSNIPSITVTITRESGTVTYTKSLEKVLEPNRHYTVNLIVTYRDGGAPFFLHDPEVTVSTPVTPDVTESEFFHVTGYQTLSAEVGSETLVNVIPLLPCEWSFELDEDTKRYFTVERVDSQLRIVAKETNEGDFRFGNIILKSKTMDYTTTFTLRQFSTRKHEVVMTYESSDSYRDIYITGENITVQDPNDGSPRFYKTANATEVRLNGLYYGATVTITGDVLKELLAVDSRQQSIPYNTSEYHLHNGYYYYLGTGYDSYYFEFKNCRCLETFIGNTRNSQLDFSQMKDITKVALGYGSLFTSITFAEGQKLESFVACHCPSISQLVLKDVSENLSYVKLYYCDALSGVNFSGFPKLRSVILDNCKGMGSIKLNNCPSIEEFSISDNSASIIEMKDCKSLKSVYLGRNISLAKFLHEGSDALESLTGYKDYTEVQELNFAGSSSLKVLDGIYVHSLDVSGCTNLVNLGYLMEIETLNMSNCPNLEEVRLDFWSSTEETYKFDNCPKLSDVYFHDMTNNCDFSPLTALTRIELDNIYGKGMTSLDFSENHLLEYVRLDSDNGSSCMIKSIVLPNSVKNFNLIGMRNLYSLDLSNHFNLKDVYLYDCYYLTDMNFSGCSSLKDIDMYDVSYYTHKVNNNTVYGNLNLSGCSSLETINNDHSNLYINNLKTVDLTGCASLDYVNLYDGIIENLNFSDSPKVKYIDIRNNNMSKDALDAMFVSLPDWSVNDGQINGVYKLSGNPGASTYDFDAAYNKNWQLVQN